MYKYFFNKIATTIIIFTLLFSNWSILQVFAAPITNTVSYTDFTQSPSPNAFLTATSVASVQSMPGITNSTPKEYSKASYTTTTCSGNEVVVGIESTGMQWTTRSYLIDNASDPNHGDILMIRKKAKHLSQLHYTFSSPIKLEEFKIEGIDNGEGVYLSADKALTIMGNNVNISASPSKLSTITQNGGTAGDITISSNEAITKLTITFGVVSGLANPTPKRQIIVKGEMKFACDTAVYTCKKPTFASSSSVGTTDLNTISANNTNPAGTTAVSWYDAPNGGAALSGAALSSATAKTYFASFATNTDSRCRTAFTVKSDFDKDGVSIDTDQDNDNDGILNSTEKYCDATTPPNGSSGFPVGTGTHKNQLLFFNLDGITIDDNTTFPVTIPSVTHNGTTYTATINKVNLSQANTLDSGVVKRVAFVGTDIGADNYSPDSNISSYYDVGGTGFKEAFYINRFVGKATMSVTIKAESGGVEYPVEAVVFDAETTTKRSDTGFEKVTIHTTGSPFKELELFHSGSVTPVYGTDTISGKDTQTLTIHNADTNTNANSFNGLWTTEGLSPTLNYTLDRMGGISTNGVGFAVRVYCDYEKDGKPNFIDTDSDNDGCFGSVEGAGTITDLQVDSSGFITGGVDANGIPTLVGASGQAVGQSREAGRVVVGTQPTSVSVDSGANANFSVAATADKTTSFDASGNPTYATTGNDTVTYTRWEVSTDGGSTWATVPSSASGTLNLTSVTADMDGNQYRAVMSCSANTCNNFSNAAILTINSYTLSYDANTGAGTMADETKLSGSTSNLTANTFTKAGYTFAGWNTQADGSGTSYANSASFTMPNANTILYAQWTANTNTAYTVEHYLQNSDGTTYPTTAHQTDNNTGTTDSTVNAGSATFTGYTYDPQNTSNVQSGTVAADGTLVLKRYYNINSYTFTFEENGGSIVANQDVNYNTNATEPTAPTKAGYVFGGWFTDNTTFANQFDFTGTPVTSNTTVYAKWIPATNTIYKTEHYRQNADGTWPTTSSFTQTLTGTTGASATAVQQSFTGYTYDSLNTNNITTGTIQPDGSLVLKMYYSINKYTVSFEENGGTIVTDQTNIPYNTTATSPANPTRVNYTFGGWFIDSALTTAFNFTTPIVSDITLHAKWDSNFSPVINANDKTITKGESLNLLDLVVSATDNEDGTITPAVAVANDGGFNANTPGVYTITFTVTDSDGNTTTQDVVVTVQEDTSSSSGGSSSQIQYVCKDKKAVNYDAFGRHKPSLCIYEENPESVEEVETAEAEGEICKEVIQKQCPIFTQHMTLGDRDGYKGKEKQEDGISSVIYQVSTLQKHLKKQGFYTGAINGIYTKETFDAVKNWQTKHFNQVLKPWNLSKPTGRFYQSSERWMNIILGCNDETTLDNGRYLSKVSGDVVQSYAKQQCKEEEVEIKEEQVQCPIFTQHMRKGDRDGKIGQDKQEAGVPSIIKEVKLLQENLTKLGFNTSKNHDGIFGIITEKAVNRFQMKYFDKVLKPWGLKQPTGRFYQSSERQMNEALGCPDIVTLDNGVLLK